MLTVAHRTRATPRDGPVQDGDRLPAGPLGAESPRRALRGHRPQPAPPRPTRAVPSRLSYALDAIPEGTRVTNSVELEVRGPSRLLGRVAVPRVRDGVAANLQRLKKLLER